MMVQWNKTLTIALSVFFFFCSRGVSWGAISRALPAENGMVFELAVELEKSEFETGEPIRLNVEGTQPYYLYVFAEALETGK